VLDFGLDEWQEEPDPLFDVARGAAEVVEGSGWGRRRIRDAPVDGTGVARELGADLADTVTEGDDEVEGLGGELVQVLGVVRAEVDAPLAHDAGCKGVKWAGVAAGAGHVDGAPGEPPEESLCHLRAAAVPGAEEEDPAAGGRAEGRQSKVEAGMEGDAATRESFSTAREVDAVVGIAAVGGAFSHGDEVRRAEAGEVVGDEALGLADDIGELADVAVTPGELREQAPTEGVASKLEKGRGSSSSHTGADYINCD
jgi:hypothetical protein